MHTDATSQGRRLWSPAMQQLSKDRFCLREGLTCALQRQSAALCKQGHMCQHCGIYPIVIQDLHQAQPGGRSDVQAS